MSQPTARDYVKSLITLQNKIQNIVNRTKYGDTDVRKAVFANCISFIRSSTISLGIVAAYNEHKFTDQTCLDIFGIQKGAAITLFEEYADYTRLSLVTMFQFQIENFLKNVLHKMTGNNPPQGFSDISKSLLGLISISDSQSKQKILYVPAMIRNSYHSNGIHTKGSKTVTIDGEDFEFIQGSTVSCVSWDHIFKSFTASIDIIDEIVSTVEVSNITDKVSDQYFP